MLQLNPQKNFPIVRQLSDPSDTGTYYLRAYVRDSQDGTLLDTVDLEDKGTQRFVGIYRTPADPSGEGRFIDVNVRVFTDSGYTTESTKYGRTVDTFLVIKQYNPVYGGGGGGYTDYNKIKKIVRKETKKQVSKIKIPKPPKQKDVSPIVKTEKVDLGAIQASIKGVRDAIDNIPKPEKVDFRGVYTKLENITKKVREMLESLNKERKADAAKIKKGFDELLEEIRNVTFVTLRDKEREENKNKKPWRNNY